MENGHPENILNCPCNHIGGDSINIAIMKELCMLIG